MDLAPQPPQDTELRNIIDKLAQFVARNGPDFEQMTKTKQKGNPKFQFLYGGEYYDYYQYKVNTEQAVFKSQGILDNNNQNMWNPQQIEMNNAEIEQISQQQDVLREQIKQSENNLSAQHTVLLQQQQAQLEVSIAKFKLKDLQKECEEAGIHLDDVYTMLQPIIDICTKDSISNGKAWILQHGTNKLKITCILHCLLHKVTNATTFNQKLHIIYLVNDLLHHCARKNAVEIKTAIEAVVIPMFCNASIIATEDQKQKLLKLIKLWESKTNYLCSEVVEKMKNPIQSYQEYQNEQLTKYSNEVNVLTQQTKTTFDGYQSQHQAFVCHAMQQIMDLQQRKQALEQTHHHQPPQPQQHPPPPPQPPVTVQIEQVNHVPTSSNIIPLETIQASLQQTIQSLSMQNNPPPHSQPPPTPQQTFPSVSLTNSGSSNTTSENYMPPLNVPPPNMNLVVTQANNNNVNANLSVVPPINGMENPFSLPPPGFFPPPGFLPDLTKPPPGFNVIPEPLEVLLPTAPYYDLPAGLIVPLVKLEDTSFKPLDPKDIRLPAPAPPSDRLLAAVEAFYSLPSHERPRDSEGWEKLGLYEYYKAKNSAKMKKEEMIESGLREKSRSPSPVGLIFETEPTPPKRRYTSKSPSPTPPAPPPTKPSRPKSRSRSRSPPPRRRKSSKNGRSRRKSKSRSPSRSPVRWSERRRSISPPAIQSFSNAMGSKIDTQELDPSNKGHQMLRKMGWGGSGLGANEQGIDAPISGGDVRDRQDQFKGVGCNLNDPYENFRKNKGAAFITRMKARAEERANESKLIDY